MSCLKLVHSDQWSKSQVAEQSTHNMLIATGAFNSFEVRVLERVSKSFGIKHTAIFSYTTQKRVRETLGLYKEVMGLASIPAAIKDLEEL